MQRWRGVAAGFRRAALGLWFGSVCCFSFLVAPTLFRVIRNAPADRSTRAPNALAGDVVVPVLQSLAWMALVLGLVTLLLTALDAEKHHLKWRVAGIGLGLLSVIASMTWLTPTMLDLLAQMNAPVDALELTHPLRVQFDGLHKYSSSIHLFMLLGPLLALWLEGAPAVTPRGSLTSPASQ
jgi:hypothetical protein